MHEVMLIFIREGEEQNMTASDRVNECKQNFRRPNKYLMMDEELMSYHLIVCST